MNVIWFCLDTLRADHLGCYGYSRETSPAMDRLAREGALFPQSRANAVATGPAFTSMFTGLYAINAEWYMTPFDLPNMINFPDDVPTLPEMIWEHGGITTAAFDNLINFASHMKQFVRGFEYYVNVTRTPRPIHHHVVGGTVNERLLPWIATHRDERFFLFVHYWDPHLPYNQPEEFARPFVHESGSLEDLEVRQAPAGYEYVPGWGTVEQIPKTEWPEHFQAQPGSPHRYPACIDAYDGEIRYTDRLVEQVANALADADILGDTAIIINADHGEQLNQHANTWGHAGLHDAVVFTPLIIWRPGLIPEGIRPEGYVHHLDIAPTILEILGCEPTAEMDGTSVLGLLRGEAEPREHYYTESMGLRAVVRGDFKYIWHKYAPDELYNLAADPMEMVNLINDEPKRAEALRGELLSWVAASLGERVDPMIDQMATVEKMRRRPHIYL